MTLTNTPENITPVENNENLKPSLEWGLDYKNQPKLKDLCKEDQTKMCENNVAYVKSIIAAAENNWDVFEKTNIMVADVMDTMEMYWIKPELWDEWYTPIESNSSIQREKPKKENPNEWWNYINWKKYPDEFSV